MKSYLPLCIQFSWCLWFLSVYLIISASLFSTDLPTSTMISTLPSNTTILRGATVELNCRTDANPGAHIYQFYLNGNLVANSSSGVFNVTVKADGVYTCVPINTVGTGDNDTVSITAVGKKSKHLFYYFNKEVHSPELYAVF